jgi:hypothetical protein
VSSLRYVCIHHSVSFDFKQHFIRSGRLKSPAVARKKGRSAFFLCRSRVDFTHRAFKFELFASQGSIFPHPNCFWDPFVFVSGFRLFPAHFFEFDFMLLTQLLFFLFQ